jgi:hypothetical protein
VKRLETFLFKGLKVMTGYMRLSFRGFIRDALGFPRLSQNQPNAN